MSAYLLGLDIGTTGCKAVLVDAEGSVRATATSEYPLSTPRPLWAEQQPEVWWRATLTSLDSVFSQSRISPSRVVGLGLTGQMHGLVLLDARGEVLRPCIMWNDQRTESQCAAITRQLGPRQVLDLTGNRVLPGFTAPKLLWVHEHESEIYKRIAKVLLPKDYIRYRLTGELFSEVSDASGTSWFEVGRRRWSEDMLRALEVPRDWLPEVSESPEVTARLGPAARQTGLPEGLPVVGGAGDQAAQAVGTGLVSEGLVAVTIGTSGVVFAPSASYRVEPEGRLHAFCHAVPGQWHLMGVMLSAGGSLRWYRDALGHPEIEQARLAGQDPYEILTSAATSAPPGCEGLFFLPYLMGERTPYPDPNARGAFIGLTLRHKKPHLTRAVLEGVAYGLRDSLELLRALQLPLEQVRTSGGGARSALWRQILADVFDTEIATVSATEGAAYGAALLAGVGVGIFPSVSAACQKAIHVTEMCRPGPAVPAYKQFYACYRALYPALAPVFRQLSGLGD